MKVKTSVNIERKALHTVKREGKRRDRSVSYLLEEFIERLAEEIESGKIVVLPNDDEASTSAKTKRAR